MHTQPDQVLQAMLQIKSRGCLFELKYDSQEQAGAGVYFHLHSLRQPYPRMLVLVGPRPGARQPPAGAKHKRGYTVSCWKGQQAA